MTKHWDHAFASGRVYKSSGGPGVSRLIDPFFWVAEKLYGDYCVRRLWRSWHKAAVCAPAVSLGGNARMINKHVREAVRIGNNTVCRGTIRVEHGGTLTIGEEVYLGDDTIISAAKQISIGSGTLVAHRVQIFDNTSHSIDWHEREQHFRKILGQKIDLKIEIPAASVIIGNNCWLGFGSTILKGVTIGDRSIVAAGCIVTDNVPPDTLVVGSKATFIDLKGRT